MKLGFFMPHMLRLKAMTQPWEAAVTGSDQTRFAKWAEKLGYAMIPCPNTTSFRATMSSFPARTT